MEGYDGVFGENSVSEELRNLVKTRNLNGASTRRLRTIVEQKCSNMGQLNNNFNNNKQHDAGEFMLSLLEHLWNEHTQSSDTLKEDVFGAVSQAILSCDCGNRVELPYEQMSEIVPVQVVDGNVQRGLEELFIPEMINWKCPKCKNTTVEQKLTLIQEPSTLILKLMRYEFDNSRKKISKVNVPVICPRNLRMSCGSRYCLKSYISHIGEHTRSGHYTTTLFDAATDEVVVLDDDKVYDLADAYDEKSEMSYIFIYEKSIEK